MTQFWIILCILSLFGSLAMAEDAGPYKMVPGEYEEIRDLTLYIRNKFPPTEYYYVAVGRSPAPVMAFMEAAHLNNIVQLPYSNTRALPENKVIGLLQRDKYAQSRNGRLERGTERELFAHFERALPSSELLKGRKLLFIDYVQSSLGLVSAGEYAQVFYRQKNSTQKVEMLALVEPRWQRNSTITVDALRDYLSVPLHGVLLPEESVLGWHMNANRYDHYSKFGSYNPVYKRSELVLEKEQSGYQGMKSVLEQRIKLDPDFIGPTRVAQALKRFSDSPFEKFASQPVGLAQGLRQFCAQMRLSPFLKPLLP